MAYCLICGSLLVLLIGAERPMELDSRLAELQQALSDLQQREEAGHIAVSRRDVQRLRALRLRVGARIRTSVGTETRPSLAYQA